MKFEKAGTFLFGIIPEFYIGNTLFLFTNIFINGIILFSDYSEKRRNSMEPNTALQVYEMAQNVLKEMDMDYSKDDTCMRIGSVFQGEDIPMEVSIRVCDEAHSMFFTSYMSTDIPPQGRIDGAVAVVETNYRLPEGMYFDYDMADGSICFRTVIRYKDSVISEKLIKEMLDISLEAIDRYNDKFDMLAKGMYTLEQYLNIIKKDD